MKENVLEVLMYLFENYFYDEPDEQPDRECMEENLHEAGFSNGEIDKAFEWLDGLAEQRFQPDFRIQSDEPIRVFIESEVNRLDTDCRDFLMYLSNAGVLDAQRRELVLDRLMALESDEISLEDVKWVVLMVLFNQPGAEAAYAWMESQIFQDEPEPLH